MLAHNHHQPNTNTSSNSHLPTYILQYNPNHQSYIPSQIHSTIITSTQPTQHQHQLELIKSIQQRIKSKDIIIFNISKQVHQLQNQLQIQTKKRQTLQINFQQLQEKYKTDTIMAQEYIKDFDEIIKQNQILQKDLLKIKKDLTNTKIINEQLQSQIEFLSQANRITKQALLYSQQQNYNFRLQIRKFLKQKDNLHDLSTQRSQIKYLDELSNGDSRTKNQAILSKSIDIDQLELFRKQIYAEVFKIINYLPIHQDQLLVYEAQNEDQVLYQLQSIKNICFSTYQQRKNYQNDLNILEKQMVVVLHRIVEKYRVPEEQLQSHLDQLHTINNLKNYAHEIYSQPFITSKSGQLLMMLQHQ